MRTKQRQKRVSNHNSILSLTRSAALATYDREADAAYFRVRKGKVARTVELQRWLLADLDIKGSLLGVEMLFVSRQLPRSQIREFVSPVAVRAPMMKV
ncbi:MAG: DUF2283 domain-containing protein [bacterium]|nr:DUF2283 domain-containing protein [bacterium]